MPRLDDRLKGMSESGSAFQAGDGSNDRQRNRFRSFLRSVPFAALPLSVGQQDIIRIKAFRRRVTDAASRGGGRCGSGVSFSDVPTDTGPAHTLGMPERMCRCSVCPERLIHKYLINNHPARAHRALRVSELLADLPANLPARCPALLVF